MRVLLTIMLSFILLTGCSSMFPGTSKFSKSNSLLGTEKKDFLTKYGMPYSLDSSYDDDNRLVENLYYRESVYSGGERNLMTMFVFVDSKLVSQKVVSDEKSRNNCENHKDKIKHKTTD